MWGRLALDLNSIKEYALANNLFLNRIDSMGILYACMHTMHDDQSILDLSSIGSRFHGH